MARKPAKADTRADELLSAILLNAMGHEEAARTLGWQESEVAEVAASLEGDGKIEYRRPGIMSLAK